jgi:hypothetical protein
MRHTIEWALAYSRFQTFRNSLPGLIDEDCVSEYHAIIESLEPAGQSDLDDFRIDESKLALRMVQARAGEHIACTWEFSTATKNTATGNISAASSMGSKTF